MTRIRRNLSLLAVTALCSLAGCRVPPSPAASPPDPSDSQIRTATFSTSHVDGRAKWELTSAGSIATVTLTKNPSQQWSDKLDSGYAFSLNPSATYLVTLDIEYQVKPIRDSPGPGSRLITIHSIQAHNEQGLDGPEPQEFVITHPVTGGPEDWRHSPVVELGTFSGAFLNSPEFGVSLGAARAADVVASCSLRLHVRAQEQ